MTSHNPAPRLSQHTLKLKPGTEKLASEFVSQFYVTVHHALALKNGYSPYETVILSNPLNNKFFVGHLEFSSQVGKTSLYVDKTVLSQLEVAEGASVKALVNEIVPVADRCQIRLLHTAGAQVDAATEEDTYKKLKNEIRYHPFAQKSTFTYNSNTYCVKIFPENHAFGFIGQQTKIRFSSAGLSVYTNCIGLEEPLHELKTILDWPIKYPQVLEKFKLVAPKGVLLHGPPGCGKTHLVRQMAKTSGRKFYYTGASGLEDKYVGQSEKNLRDLFEKARANSPSIIFIDELESVAGSREALGVSEHRKSVVAELLNCMDGLESRGDVVVIGATNMRDSLDMAVTRPGRFDRDVAVKPPNEQQRKKLFESLFKNVDHRLDISELANMTNGYTPADLLFLVKEAKINACAKIIQAYEESEKPHENPLTEVPAAPLPPPQYVITPDDISKAYDKIRPTLLRGLAGSSLETRMPDFSHIGGYDEVKRKISDYLLSPKLYPQIYKDCNLSLPKGMIIYGPPGTGKTTISKSIAKTLGYNLVLMASSELVVGVVGETQRKIRTLFARARDAAPTVLCLDELDAIAHRRDETGPTSGSALALSTLLTQIDGLKESDGVIVVGTTNRKDQIDPAMLRAGRLELQLQMDAPTLDQIVDIFHKKCSALILEDPQECVKCIRRWFHVQQATGADIMAIVRDTVSACLKELSKEKIDEIKAGGKLTVTSHHLKAAYRSWLEKKSRDEGSDTRHRL